MNYKTKSLLYFASLVLAVVTYYNIGHADTVQNIELAENTIESFSTHEALKY